MPRFSLCCLVREFLVKSSRAGKNLLVRHSFCLRSSIACSAMAPDIQKSPNDPNLYKAITLSNGLRALLISDQSAGPVGPVGTARGSGVQDEDSGQESAGEGEAEDATSEDEVSTGTPYHSKKKAKMAAAALCIGVGSFSDPPEVQGLAHFLEHMVFMGSEKYPEENAYDSFISKHGGSDNASTDCERTVFELDVTPEYLKDALDIFAHCFILPLLRHSSMEREVEAVHHEFELAAPDDTERLLLLFGSLARPGHPMANFFWGNSKSLKEIPASKNIDLNRALVHFYKRYYSASFMTLAVQSTETLETLEKWVREIFSSIPNNGLAGPRFESLQEPFKTDKFNKLYKAIPVKKVHKVHLTWALPPLMKYYKTKPLSYLGWVIGHEGRGSILACLRQRAWAVELEAGNDGGGFDLNSTCSLFNINITLTENGIHHIAEVLAIVFQYIRMLQEEGPKEYLFRELQIVTEQKFRYQEQREPFDYVSRLAQSMQVYPREHYLSGRKLFFEYNEGIIADCLSRLTPEEVNIGVLSNLYSEDDGSDWQVEKWMHCKYSVHDIPSEWRSLWREQERDPSLHLPEPNIFIATEFELKRHEEPLNEYPVKAFEDGLCRIWYKEDTKFKVPKGYAYFHIMSPLWHSSPRNSAMTILFCSLMEHLLCEDTYPARLAGLQYIISYSNEGVTLKVYGFNHKIQLLLETILNGMSKLLVQESLFNCVKEHNLEEFHNLCIKPDKLCRDLMLSVLQDPYWLIIDKKTALENITLELISSHVKQCFSSAFLEGLIQGNFTKEEALVLGRTVVEKLGLIPVGSISDMRAMQLNCGTTYCRVSSLNKDDVNSKVCTYYQLGPGSVKTNSKLDLLLDFMEEPCFDVLRTNHQLGYNVGCREMNLSGILGFFVSVSTPSNKFSCDYVDERIEEFLQNFLTGLRKIGADEYFTQLESLIKCKKCEDLNLEEEVQRHWIELWTHNYVFDRKKKEIECLEQLDMHDFMEWLEKTVLIAASERRKLCVQVVGHGDTIVSSDGGSTITDNDGMGNNAGDDDEADAGTGDGRCNSDSMSLKFLSDRAKTDAAFVTSIGEFKSSLTVYPVHKIT